MPPNRLTMAFATSPAYALQDALQPPDPYGVTPAQGWAANAQAIGDYIAQQRAFAQMGLYDPSTGLPTQARLLDAARQYSNSIMLGTTAPGAPPANAFSAYHGSPRSFDRFSSSNIGTGEGAAAHGHGLYLAADEGVARAYRDQLSKPKVAAELTAAMQDYNLNYWEVDRAWDGPKAEFDAAVAARGAAHAHLQDLKALPLPPANAGAMYHVQVNADPASFLDWDKPVHQQPAALDAISSKYGDPAQFIADHGLTLKPDPTGYTVQTIEPATMYNSRQRAISILDPQGRNVGQRSGYRGTDDQALADYLAGQAASGADLVKAMGAASSPDQASAALEAAGIPGIKYLDGQSRAAGAGSQNYVVFDDATLAILRKYGIGGLGIGLVAAADVPARGSGDGGGTSSTDHEAGGP